MRPTSAVGCLHIRHFFGRRRTNVLKIFTRIRHTRMSDKWIYTNWPSMAVPNAGLSDENVAVRRTAMNEAINAGGPPRGDVRRVMQLMNDRDLAGEAEVLVRRIAPADLAKAVSMTQPGSALRSIADTVVATSAVLDAEKVTEFARCLAKRGSYYFALCAIRGARSGQVLNALLRPIVICSINKMDRVETVSAISVTEEALKLMSNLHETTLCAHMHTLMKCLDNDAEAVRTQALKTMANVNPAALARHAEELLVRLKDVSIIVRANVLRTLSCLRPPDLAAHAPVVMSQLNSRDGDGGSIIDVRCAAVDYLAGLDERDFVDCMPWLMRSLRDHDARVRGRVATVFLRRMKMASIATYRRELNECLRSETNESVRFVIGRILGTWAWRRFRVIFRAERLLFFLASHSWAPGKATHQRLVQEWASLGAA